MRSQLSTVALLFAVARLSSAQSSQTIDPDTVTIENRNQWCLSQTSQCPLICLQTAGNDDTTEENDCDADTLQYSCVCSNGISPNISEYSQTMPYYICTENNNRCVSNCGSGDNACASSCRTDHPCGAQNPTRINATTSTASSTSASATSSSTDGGSDYSSFGDGNSDDSSSSSKKSDALELGAKYGLAMVISGLVGGAAILL